LREELAEGGFVEGKSYWLVNFSSGATLAPNSKQVYFECTEAVASAVAEVTAMFTFKSALGDRYKKQIMILPPGPGATSAALDVDYAGFD
jgi:hypothetical protein